MLYKTIDGKAFKCICLISTCIRRQALRLAAFSEVLIVQAFFYFQNICHYPPTTRCGVTLRYSKRVKFEEKSLAISSGISAAMGTYHLSDNERTWRFHLIPPKLI
jgi:hypothetical protein